MQCTHYVGASRTLTRYIVPMAAPPPISSIAELGTRNASHQCRCRDPYHIIHAPIPYVQERGEGRRALPRASDGSTPRYRYQRVLTRCAPVGPGDWQGSGLRVAPRAGSHRRSGAEPLPVRTEGALRVCWPGERGMDRTLGGGCAVLGCGEGSRSWHPAARQSAGMPLVEEV